MLGSVISDKCKISLRLRHNTNTDYLTCLSTWLRMSSGQRADRLTKDVFSADAASRVVGGARFACGLKQEMKRLAHFYLLS